jgi:hypothetical protein
MAKIWTAEQSPYQKPDRRPLEIVLFPEIPEVVVLAAITATETNTEVVVDKDVLGGKNRVVKLKKKPILICVVLAVLLTVRLYNFEISPKKQLPLAKEIKVQQKPPQFVILSFDGSRSLEMWKETLDFARNKDIQFTYFVSGVYFLPFEDRAEYQSPGEASGESKIGFADNSLDVSKRVGFVNMAIAAGHEIASHLNGHFPGGKWNETDWQQEFATFKRLVSYSNIVGFRAPNLETNQYLWPVLAKAGYLYEAGQIGKSDQWPVKIDNIWRIVLPGINLSGTKKYPLAMDYNFYLTQTGGRDLLKKGTPEWQKALTQTVNSLNAYFEYNLTHNRAPVVFACHFSEWNNGLYWAAMKAFAEKVCGKPDVKCTTYKSLVNYMEQNPLQNPAN